MSERQTLAWKRKKIAKGELALLTIPFKNIKNK
jgi:hypothetical protein